MSPACPHCDLPMKKQGSSKIIKAIGYYCPTCGQHFTKVAGEKGYHKGQVINLSQYYWRKNK